MSWNDQEKEEMLLKLESIDEKLGSINDSLQSISDSVQHIQLERDSSSEQEAERMLSSIESSTKTMASFVGFVVYGFWALIGIGLISFIWDHLGDILGFLYAVFVSIPAWVYRFFVNNFGSRDASYIREVENTSDILLALGTYAGLLVLICVVAYSNRESKKKAGGAK